MSLAELLPGSRSLVLAGHDLICSPWRLCDLLELERWLSEQAPNPLEGFPSLEDDPDVGTRKRRLREVMTKAKNWPPRLDSDEGRELLATTQGVLFFLWVALHRDNPTLNVEDVATLAAEMTTLDWQRLNRILWVRNPQEEILREVTPWRFDDGDPIHWNQVIDHLSTEREMSYEEVLYLSLPVAFNMLSGGEKRSYGLENPSAQAAQDFRRAFLDDDEIPAFEVREAELFAEMKANEARAAAEAETQDKYIERDAARLGMHADELASSLAELDAQVAAAETTDDSLSPDDAEPPDSQ